MKISMLIEERLPYQLLRISLIFISVIIWLSLNYAIACT
jgi:hypothetical protein